MEADFGQIIQMNFNVQVKTTSMYILRAAPSRVVREIKNGPTLNNIAVQKRLCSYFGNEE
jgi:hypothetical protein